MILKIDTKKIKLFNISQKKSATTKTQNDKEYSILKLGTKKGVTIEFPQGNARITFAQFIFFLKNNLILNRLKPLVCA